MGLNVFLRAPGGVLIGSTYTLQGLDFDLKIETSNSIVLQVDFLLNLEGVDPFVAIQDAVSSINQTLQSAGGEFHAVAGDFVDDLSTDGIKGFLQQISENVKLALDAKIDLSVFVELSFDSSPTVSSELRELSTALAIRVQDEFSSTSENIGINITAELALLLNARNNAVPFNVLNNSSKLSQFDFQGSLETRSIISVSGIPAAITLEASVPELTALDNSSSVQFEIFLDIDLRPIRQRK